MPDKTIQGTINITNVNVTNSLTENGKKVSQFVETTYADLVTLRNNNQLVAGCKYRITDFVTTTAQANTLSANHAFDIVVTALTSSQLSENAEALLHEGDTYFANSKLSAWELKYCLDNDTSRFAWADATNGKGIIYHMKDERGNCCSYDFKNIKFKTNKRIYATIDKGNVNNEYSTYFELDETQNVGNLYAWRADYQRYTTSLKLVFTDTKTPITSSTLYAADGTVITNVIIDSISTNSERILYTFNGFNVDESMLERCHDNVIAKYIVNNILSLNFTIIEAHQNYTCYANKIDINNNHNIFDYNMHNTTIGANCYANEIGISFYQNTIGVNFYNNVIGNNSYDNIIQSNFYNNNIGYSMTHNNFGNDIFNNKIAQNMSSNIIGNYFNRNSIGANFTGNNIGNDVSSNVFGSHCSYNVIDCLCMSNTFGSASSEFYMSKCTFDSGLFNVTVSCNDTVASSENQIQNIHVHSGIRYRSIIVPDRNLQYSIDYYVSNSQEIFL